MFLKAKQTAKQRGLNWALTEADIYWPEYCPVLGIKLDYENRGGRRDNVASFDRWDNDIEYLPGNVFVISWRANRIKWDCTTDELVAVAAYSVRQP